MNREDMEKVEIKKTVLMIKKRLHELSKVISPEMYAFTKLYLPKVNEISIFNNI